MAKLETETKRLIEFYYRDLIDRKENDYDIEKKIFKEKTLYDFNTDVDVLKVRALFLNIVKKYGEESTKLYCDFNTSWYSGFNEKMVKIKKEIEELKKEKMLLLVTLENNSKNSKEYKNALDNFMKKYKKGNKND